MENFSPSRIQPLLSGESRTTDEDPRPQHRSHLKKAQVGRMAATAPAVPEIEEEQDHLLDEQA